MSFFYAEISYPDGTIVGTDNDDYLYGTDNGEMILGKGGNDWLRGNGGNDGLHGEDGNDLLEGGYGNDYLNGGLGNDTVSYTYANHAIIANLEFNDVRTLGPGPEDTDTLNSIENLIGSSHNDYIQGSELMNRLDGYGGNDVIQGWGGSDVLDGNFGDDYLVGGEGNDVVIGGFGTDTLQGNNGFDTADYSYSYQGVFVSLAAGQSRTLDPSYYVDTDTLSSIEKVIGTYFDDRLEGDANANVLDGGDGNDIFLGTAGPDTVYGGAGIDQLIYHSSGNVVGIDLSTGYGTLGDALWDRYFDIENITGTDHAAGDVLTGNDIANWIDGRGGNDVIRGRGGNDTLQSGYGNDFVDGGDGNDTINGGDGADTLDGGAGFDTADFNPSFGGIGPEGPGVTVNLLAGTASGLGNDGEQLSNIEAVIGTSFDDVIDGSEVGNILRGGGNQDTLRGGGGNDVLCGQAGNDVLNGQTGNDRLFGGFGRDVMTGGLGNDSFFFQALADTGATAATRDIITEFTKGADVINLSAIDANGTIGGNQAFTFIDDDPFSATFGAGQLRSSFEGGNTVIEGEVTGDAVADFQILLFGEINLSVLDFVL